MSETFTYDALDRMLTFSVASDAVGPYERSREYRYDAAGNITYQTGGSYGVSYDGVGNVVSSGNGRTYQYTPFNKPYEITDPSGASVQFYYGADGLRYKKTNGTVTTLYMDKFYELKTSSNMIEEMSFIYFGKRAVGRKTVTKDTSGQMTGQALNYYHTDALGSVTAITGDDGTVLERRSYEPFGRIRAIDYMGTLNDPLPNTVAFSTRSFTGHEQIEEISGLIHMNGRVYDSTLGRFLSADPHIQAPDDSQSYNRYSYVRNNPLKYTDPSGYSWFSDFWKQYGKTITSIVITAVIVAASIYLFGLPTLAELTLPQQIVYGGLVGAIGGGIHGHMVTGTAEGALVGATWGAVSAAAAAGIGGYFGHGADALWLNGSPEELARSIAHGLSRAMIVKMQGGNFRAGFWSGFAASALSPGTTFGNASLGRVGGFAARTTIAATVGGTASELGGGKFANGAVSGAFVHMFNAEMHGAIILLQEFLSGENQTHVFGPENPMTIDLQNSPKLRKAINQWIIEGHSVGESDFLDVEAFSPIGEGMLNFTRQFVGTFTTSIYQTGMNQVTVVLYNSTSWRSASLHLLPHNFGNAVKQWYWFMEDY